MGNNHNSRLKTEIEWPRNEYGYLKTKIPDIDGVFERAGKLFDDFENYRITLKQKQQKAHEIAGTDQLEHPQVLHPFRIMLWSLSAASEGNLKKHFTLITEPVYRFSLPHFDGMNNHTWELFQVCDELIKTFSEASNAEPMITNRAQQIFEEITEISRPEYLKAVAFENNVARQDIEWIIEKNEDMFAGIYNIMFSWNDKYLMMGQEFTNLLTNIAMFLKEADVIGKEAIQKHVKDPKEVLISFQHYLLPEMGNNLCHEEVVSQKQDFAFVKTEVAEIDSYFDRVSEMFDEYEGHRMKLQECLKKAHRLAGTNQLWEPNMTDPFRVMLWAMSAASAGKIKTIIEYSTDDRVTLSFKSPESTDSAALELYETVNELMSIYHETIEQAPIMNQRIKDLLLEMSELKKFTFVKNHTLKNFVSRRDFDKEVEKNELAYLAMNKALIDWNNLHFKVGKEYRAILQKMDKYIEEADTIGVQAHEQKIFDPRDIYEAFHEGVKPT